MITWDERKRKQVIKHHGVDLGKLADVLSDPYAIHNSDREHSDTEERWLTIGRSAEYGIVAVIYTFRGEDVRLITARRAERWMVRMYEKQRKRT